MSATVLRKVFLPVNQAWLVMWHDQRIAGPVSAREADRIIARALSCGACGVADGETHREWCAVKGGAHE